MSNVLQVRRVNMTQIDNYIPFNQMIHFLSELETALGSDNQQTRYTAHREFEQHRKSTPFDFILNTYSHIVLQMTDCDFDDKRFESVMDFNENAAMLRVYAISAKLEDGGASFYVQTMLRCMRYIVESCPEVDKYFRQRFDGNPMVSQP